VNYGQISVPTAAKKKLIGAPLLLVKDDTRCCELFIGALLCQFGKNNHYVFLVKQGLQGLEFKTINLKAKLSEIFENHLLN
jgi:hypothetical protein